MAIATAVDVVNLGLSFLKVPLVTQFTTPVNEVQRVCNLWYDPSRLEALRAHPWSFAKERARLVKSATAPTFGYDSMFPLPTDFVRLRFIGEDNYGLVGIDFDIESTYMLVDDEITTYSTVDITGISKASPGVVTAAGHGYANGDIVLIEDVVGMTEVNDVRFMVADTATNTFSLKTEAGVAVNTSAYTTYVSGGTVDRVDTIDIGYVKDITDVTKFDSLFVNYLALVFAKNICFGVTGKTTLRRDLREMLIEMSNQARAVNGQDKPPVRVTRSRAVGARRTYSSGGSVVQSDPKYMPI